MMRQTASRQFTAILADDHQIVRSGLRMAIESPGVVEDDGIAVLAEAANGLEAIEQIKIHQPDLLLLDISMPIVSGAEILLDIKRWSPETKIVILTAVTSPGLLAGLVHAGIDGLFSKASNNDALFSMLPLILRGARHIEPAFLDIIRDSAPLEALTPREQQTLNMIVTGKSNKEIAELMGVSPKTAEKHRTSLMQKLKVRSIAELLAKALREGLIEEHRHL